MRSSSSTTNIRRLRNWVSNIGLLPYETNDFFFLAATHHLDKVQAVQWPVYSNYILGQVMEIFAIYPARVIDGDQSILRAGKLINLANNRVCILDV